MFTINNKTQTEDLRYKFDLPENSTKWIDLFIPAFKEINLRYLNLVFKKDFWDKIGSMIYQVFSKICMDRPHTLQDVIMHIKTNYEEYSLYWLNTDEFEKLPTRKLNTFIMPVENMHQLLIKDIFQYKCDVLVTVGITAFLESVANDLIKLVTLYLRDISMEPDKDDVFIALHADKALKNVFITNEDEDDDKTNCNLFPIDSPINNLNSEDLVKEFLKEEEQYVRELSMMLKLFKPPMMNIIKETDDNNIGKLFDIINDFRELSIKLIGLIDDVNEARQYGEKLYIGSCFDELLEGSEFDIYDQYFYTIIKMAKELQFNNWLQFCDVKLFPLGMEIEMIESIRYVLPHLFLDPLWYYLHYCETIKRLLDLNENDEDIELLQEAFSRFLLLASEIEKFASHNINMQNSKRLGCFDRIVRRGSSPQKLDEIQNSIDGWNGKNLSVTCTTYITEGSLQKQNGQRLSDRHVFLFDKLLIFTKKIIPPSSMVRKSTSSLHGIPLIASNGSLMGKVTEDTALVPEFKFKEKFKVHKLKFIDRPNSDDFLNSIKLLYMSKPPSSHVLVFKNSEDKMHWISSLLFIPNQSFLNRKFDNLLKEESLNQCIIKPSLDYKKNNASIKMNKSNNS